MHVFLATFQGKTQLRTYFFLHNLWSMTLVYYSKCKFSYVKLPLCIIDKTAQTSHLAALVLAAVILPGHRKPTSYHRTLPMLWFGATDLLRLYVRCLDVCLTDARFVNTDITTHRGQHSSCGPRCPAHQSPACGCRGKRKLRRSRSL